VCSLTSSNSVVRDTMPDHKQAIWNTLKRWFSIHEIKEPESFCEYFEWYLSLEDC
jgi:hypothetical protein